MKFRSLQIVTVLILGIFSAFVIRNLLFKPSATAADERVPFGVLGDSDSHSFHDGIILSEPKLRGGHYRNVTYQWTEVIARLRSDQIDMGAWGTWGLPGRVAALAGLLGFEDRAPRKQDYQYNFAISGAKCSNLTDGMARQTQRLLYLMDQAPSKWERGIVTIRIGINNLGGLDALNRFAANGLSSTAAAEVVECTDYIRHAVDIIRSKHHKTRIVLIGILSNADYVPWISHWQSHNEIDNISAVMDAFDNVLREIAAGGSNIYFWDDRKWFAENWGARDENGRPAYKAVLLDGNLIQYSQGDHPHNAILADGHAGTVWNGLWAKDLLDTLNRQFGYHFERITEAELVRLANLDRAFDEPKTPKQL